jgi:hypothetical protein
MERTLFLHVGGPKTGTTYLQQLLFRNQQRLRENGVLYPGTAMRSHFWAAQDLRGVNFKDYQDPNIDGAWPRMVAEAEQWSGNVIIDHEMFAAASRAQIDRALHDLRFAEVHLVWTARDLARQLPAAWQERIKNRETITFHDFLKMVYAALDETPPHPFWRFHDTPAVLKRWSRGLPNERVHLITVPQHGAPRDLLWRRFASVVGLDPDAYDLEVATSNRSLGASEAGVLRHLNEMTAEAEVPWPVYAASVKHGVAPVLAARGGESIDLPADDYAWALQWSQDAVRELADRGYDVVGDLAELIPTSRPTGQDPDDLPVEELADAAMATLAALVNVTMRRPAKPPAAAAKRTAAAGALRRAAARLNRRGR